LIAIAIPSFRGMQNESKKTKAQGDVRVLKIALESYYKNHTNMYPSATTSGNSTDWQTPLINATPKILDASLYDPFATSSTQLYTYKTDTAATSSAQYYLIYSVGVLQNGTASVSTAGTVTASADVVWESNGR
jgi:type II secretory pathway pseudopilin PulG